MIIYKYMYDHEYAFDKLKIFYIVRKKIHCNFMVIEIFWYKEVSSKNSLVVGTYP